MSAGDDQTFQVWTAFRWCGDPPASSQRRNIAKFQPYPRAIAARASPLFSCAFFPFSLIRLHSSLPRVHLACRRSKFEQFTDLANDAMRRDAMRRDATRRDAISLGVSRRSELSNAKATLQQRRRPETTSDEEPDVRLRASSAPDTWRGRQLAEWVETRLLCPCSDLILTNATYATYQIKSARHLFVNYTSLMFFAYLSYYDSISLDNLVRRNPRLRSSGSIRQKFRSFIGQSNAEKIENISRWFHGVDSKGTIDYPRLFGWYNKAFALSPWAVRISTEIPERNTFRTTKER